MMGGDEGGLIVARRVLSALLAPDSVEDVACVVPDARVLLVSVNAGGELRGRGPLFVVRMRGMNGGIMFLANTIPGRASDLVLKPRVGSGGVRVRDRVVGVECESGRYLVAMRSDRDASAVYVAMTGRAVDRCVDHRDFSLYRRLTTLLR